MNCPECKSNRVEVIDSRRQDTVRRTGRTIAETKLLIGNVIVRRRECRKCFTRFWTVEEIKEVETC